MVFIALAIFGIDRVHEIGRSPNPPGTDVSDRRHLRQLSGASPQEMERLIVKPIEDQLDGIDNLDQLTATAQEGAASSSCSSSSAPTSNIAAINVQSAVDTARVYLPADLDPPSVYRMAPHSR